MCGNLLQPSHCPLKDDFSRLRDDMARMLNKLGGVSHCHTVSLEHLDEVNLEGHLNSISLLNPPSVVTFLPSYFAHIVSVASYHKHIHPKTIRWFLIS